MRIECLHGYFKFTETRPGQMSHFVSRYGLELSRSGDHFTFTDLVDAPRLSIAGSLYLGAPATKTYSGETWEILKENGLVYNFNRGLVVPIITVTQTIKLASTGNYLVSNGMILPGSLKDAGSRVTDYAAFFSADRGDFKYSEVEYA